MVIMCDCGGSRLQQDTDRRTVSVLELLYRHDCYTGWCTELGDQQWVERKMASSDFLENAISSKIDEKSLNDLTNSLESGLPNSQSVANTVSVDGKSNFLLLR